MTPEEACQTKEHMYRYRHTAEVVADYLNRWGDPERRDKMLYVYECPVVGCGCFHLTSSPPHNKESKP